MTVIITASVAAFDFSYDMNGNVTAHYELRVEGKCVHISRRRQLVGCNGTEHTAAKVKLRDTLMNYWKFGQGPLGHTASTAGQPAGEPAPNLFIPDPIHHPWLFGQRPVFPNIDRGAYNTRHYLCGNHGSIEEFLTDPSAQRRRLLGLLPMYVDTLLRDPDSAHVSLVSMLGEEYLRQLHESKSSSRTVTGSAMGDQAMLDMLATTVNDLNIKKEYTHGD